MKNFILIVGMLISALMVNCQSETEPGKKAAIDPLSVTVLEAACDSVGIPYDFHERFVVVLLPLCEEGVYIFTPPAKQDLPCYCCAYQGTEQQNAILAKNLLANKQLFKDGKLIPGAAKKWKIIKS